MMIHLFMMDGAIALRRAIESYYYGEEATTSGLEKIEIPSTFMGNPVKVIGMPIYRANKILGIGDYAKVTKNKKAPKAMKLYEVAVREGYIGINAIDVKEVILPQSIKIIDFDAFRDCESLQKINILDSIEEIGDDAFCNCKSLEYIRIPVSVKKMGSYIFDGCENLKAIEVPFKEGEKPEDWKTNWNEGCNAQIIYQK